VAVIGVDLTHETSNSGLVTLEDREPVERAAALCVSTSGSDRLGDLRLCPGIVVLALVPACCCELAHQVIPKREDPHSSRRPSARRGE
jgi:hypothetical protein